MASIKSKKKKGWLLTVIGVIILVIGLGILLYPTISNWWNERLAKQLVDMYDKATDDMTDEDYSAYLEAARVYNEQIANVGIANAMSDPDLVPGYEDILDVTGTGVMGYVTIDKIGIKLPIYHGTSVTVLQTAAGHIQGTSVPVGGENTHATISAHRGLPSAKMFTNLDQMEVGDRFTVTILKQVLNYEVDQIVTVLPTELNDLYIQPGEDHCTLMTCTPYGVNSHRLLVRGVRVE